MRKKILKISILGIFIFSFILLYLIFAYSNIQEENQNLNRINNNLYELFKKKMENGEELIYLDKKNYKDAEDIFNILEDVSRQNPEIMYYKGAEYKLGKVKIIYAKSKEETKKHQNSIKQIRKNFIKKHIRLDMNAYEKILEAHNYIINNSSYDIEETVSEVLKEESYNAYGVLSLGKGVCEGYAKAMKYILDGLGVESIIIVGQSMGENHAWNLVKIDDEYYHIDSTWNDPISKKGENILRYNFFNLNDEEISLTHRWDNTKYPKAEGEKYNYFKYNNLVVDNKEELIKKIQHALLLQKNELIFKLLYIDKEDIDLVNEIEEIVHQNNNSMNLKAYEYSVDEEFGIINLKFKYKTRAKERRK